MRLEESEDHEVRKWIFHSVFALRLYRQNLQNDSGSQMGLEPFREKDSERKEKETEVPFKRERVVT